MPGPAPKPESQQRRKGRGLAGAVTRLPRSGRQGEPPIWPLHRQSRREHELWTAVWATPHAVAWERLGWTLEVAMYVLLFAKCERKPRAIELIERRSQADRLGLTPMSMLRLRWEITDADADADATKVVDIRERMTQVAD